VDRLLLLDLELLMFNNYFFDCFYYFSTVIKLVLIYKIKNTGPLLA